MSGKLTEPTFDRDGYPTEEALTTIAEWPVREFESFAALMGFVEKAWRYPEFFWVDEKGEYHLSTGGWSGNEGIVQAMQENLVFWGGLLVGVPLRWSFQVSSSAAEDAGPSRERLNLKRDKK